MLIYEGVKSTVCRQLLHSPLAAPRKRLLDFVSGDGQVPDALEFAAMDMKKGEKAMENAGCLGWGREGPRKQSYGSNYIFKI